MNDQYDELLEQRARLDAQIVTLRAAKRKHVIAQIVKWMGEFEISPLELGTWVDSRMSGDRRRRRAEPRYWDPVTGTTWSGRGKRPRWMAGRDPEEFRIKQGHPRQPGLAASGPDEQARDDTET
ncbi:H-NS histone family protein [Burkholderia lata]|uniref:H-NS histone family protein n=1 Tax=Burkholderia lata (strain ATCC 17760 / DSM 23089 / LMG 22485 / NCIMB 9086 / R18194 / 383) TaxID=482957 RepID=UPI0015815B51|nr:H-NS histone family protein [Burkholderia lata]